MNMENPQAHFSHEDWLDHLYRYIETARQICNELFRGLKALSQKGLLEAWSEIRSVVSKLTLLDFIVYRIGNPYRNYWRIIFYDRTWPFRLSGCTLAAGWDLDRIPAFCNFQFLF